MNKLKKIYLKLLKAHVKHKQNKAQKLYGKMIEMELEMRNERTSSEDTRET